MAAELPAIDYASLQKRQEYTFWGIVAGAVLGVIILFYLAHSQVIAPRKSELSRVRSEVVQARNELQQKTEQKQDLPYIKELHSALQEKYQIATNKETGWFFRDYWEVLDNFVFALRDALLKNGLHTACIENPPWLEFQIGREAGRMLTFPATWTAEKMREYAEVWWEALGQEQSGRARISSQGPQLQGQYLLNPIGFKMKVCGEYEEVMNFLDYLFYESRYFFAIASMKFKRVGEVGGMIVVTGTEEEVEMTGAAFWLNEQGTPNPSFLPEQFAGQMGGGAPGMGGGAPAGGRGGGPVTG
ncbi:MAG: hypothetical protein V2G48_05520 [bacterium JZ-2024 1]